MHKYIEFHVSPEDTHIWVSKLIHAVHGANSAKGNRLAVGFPGWRDAVVNDSGRKVSDTDIGSCVRVFGEDADLSEFLGSAIPVKLKRTGAAVVKGVADVPMNAGLVRYVRDRTNERHTPGEQARRERRRLRRGTSSEMHINGVRIAVRNVATLDIPSKSKEVTFPLMIARELLEQGATLKRGTSSYGLSNSVFSSVPSF